MTLPPGFRIARGAEKAVVAALEKPPEEPRVLIIPQWCVKSVSSHAAEESSSLDLQDLQRQAVEEGTARLCSSRRKVVSTAYVGAEVLENAVMEAIGGKESSAGLRGTDARQRGLDPRKIRNGASLLESDAVAPAMVVDLWSAPGLFLRHIEVRFFFNESVLLLG